MTDRRDVDPDEERAARYEQIHGTDPRDETPCNCIAEYDASLGAEYRKAFPPEPCGLDEFHASTTHNPEPT